MEPVYVIYIGLLLLALWGFVVAYREDHPKKHSTDKQ